MKCVAFLYALLFTVLSAEYYVVKLKDLDFVKSKVEKNPKQKDILEQKKRYSNWAWNSQSYMPLVVRVPEHVTAYVGVDMSLEKVFELEKEDDDDDKAQLTVGDHKLALKVERGKKFSGFLDLYAHSVYDSEFRKFKVDTNKLLVSTKEEFEKIRESAAQMILLTEPVGQAWFRSLIVEKEKKAPVDEEEEDVAIENLLVEKYYVAPLANPRAYADRIAFLAGIPDFPKAEIDVEKVKAMKLDEKRWDELNGKNKPNLPDVFYKVPVDQYCLYGDSLGFLKKFVRDVEETFGATLHGTVPRVEMKELFSKYLQQMGIGVEKFKAMDSLVDSVVLTGSDFDFHIGTDICLVMTSDKPTELLGKVIADMQGKEKVVVSSKFKNVVLDEFHVQSDDKSVSLFVARLKNCVIVSNSGAQLSKMKEVALKKELSLGESPEFHFWRKGRTFSENGGMFYFTMAGWERLLSPGHRIAAARRADAMAVLYRVAVSKMRGLNVDKKKATAWLGKVSMVDGRLVSEKLQWGRFIKPLIEWDVKKVSELEARDFGTHGWFDRNDLLDVLPPGSGVDIAYEEEDLILSTRVKDEVMPDDMAQLFSWFSKMSLSDQVLVGRADDLLSLSLSIDTQKVMGQLGFFLGNNDDKLTWVGEEWTFYLENNALAQLISRSEVKVEFGSRIEDMLSEVGFGARIQKIKGKNTDDFLEEVTKLLKGSKREVLNLEYRGVNYFKTITKGQREYGRESSFLPCYGFSKNAFLFALNEEVFKKAIDHELKLEGLKPKKKKLNKGSKVVDLTADMRTIIRGVDSQFRTQKSMKALFVLNELRRHYAEDSVKQYETMFGESLECPGGHGYRWNEKKMSYESVIYGRHGEKRYGKPFEAFSRYGKIHASVEIIEGCLNMKMRLSKGGSKNDVVTEPKILAVGKGEEILLKDYVQMDLKARHIYEVKITNYKGEIHKGQEWLEVEREGKDNYVEKGEVIRLFPVNKMEVVEDRYRMDNKGLWPKSTKYGKNDLVVTYSDPVLTIPAKFKIAYRDRYSFNSIWHYEYSTKQSLGIATKRIRRLEDVKIEAGIVPDCLLVEFEYLYNFSGRISKTDYRVWLHPDFGLVKSMLVSAYEKKERLLADIAPKGGKKKEE